MHSLWHSHTVKTWILLHWRLSIVFPNVGVLKNLFFTLVCLGKQASVFWILVDVGHQFVKFILVP